MWGLLCETNQDLNEILTGLENEASQTLNYKYNQL